MLKEFNNLKEQINSWIDNVESGDVLGEIIFPNLEIDLIVENKIFTGLRLKNISRVGRLDAENASVIHNEYINNLTRIAKNEAPIF